MDWKILAISAPLFFVTYQTLSKLLPKDTSSFLVNAYASLAGLIAMLLLHWLTVPNKSIALPQRSLIIALTMGTLIALGNYGIIKAYSLGAPQSIFSPLFYVITIVYGIIFGLLLWHEQLNLIQLLGATLSVIGIILIIYSTK